MTTAYIEDGYNESGFMKELPGVYEAVHFVFRPVLPADVRTVLHQWSEISPEEKSKRINELIVDHLLDWDLTHKGTILPINVEVLSRLKQPFVDRLFNIITYSDLSDKEYKAKQEQDEADAKN